MINRIEESIAKRDYRECADNVEMEACILFDLKPNSQNKGIYAKGHGDAVDSDGNEVEIKSVCEGSSSKYWRISHIAKSWHSGVNRVICKLETTDGTVYWFDIFEDANPEAYRSIVGRVRDDATFYANLETKEDVHWTSESINERTKFLRECLVARCAPEGRNNLTTNK